LSGYAVGPPRVVYSEEMCVAREDRGVLPVNRQISSLAQKVAYQNTIIVLDVVHLPAKPADGNVAPELRKYLGLLQAFKAAAPNVIVDIMAFPANRLLACHKAIILT
jgi:hypothetical protein